MKRHLMLFGTLILLLVSLILFYLNLSSLRPFFAFSMIYWFLLMLEPDWKLGAWILFISNSILFLYSLNIIILQKYIFVSTILTALTLIVDLIILFMAYKMKQKEIVVPDEINRNYDNEDASGFSEEENTKSKESKKPSSQIYIATKTTLHKKDCSMIKSDGKIIGSLKYAMSKGLRSCKTCNPF